MTDTETDTDPAITAEHLSLAIREWEAHAAADPHHAMRLLRQPAHFLVPAGLPPRFLPIRILLAWTLNGIPMAQPGGRSLNMASIAPALEAMGIDKVDEGNPRFDAMFETWSTACRATGKPVAAFKGDNPRTDRVFWVASKPL